MTEEAENAERAALLEKLSTYVHLDTGRKKRSDKGQSHNVDKTRIRKPILEQSKMSVYNRVRTRVENRNRELLKDGNNILSKEFDVNGFYLPIPESYATIGKEYNQVVNGRKINHTVRRVRTQKYIDLEQYRYEAWREQALAPSTRFQVVAPNSDLRGILISRYNLHYENINNIIERRAITWQDLFEEIYFVKQEDIPYFDYDTWKEHYSCIPVGTILDEDFRFDRLHKPGTPEFHPEYAEYVNKLNSIKAYDQHNEEIRRSEQYVNNMKRK